MIQFPCRPAIPAGMIALLILAGIPGALAAVTVGAEGSGGTITVATYPKGAAVYLNGDYQGISPFEMKDLPPGDYLLNISMAGYNPESFDLTLYHGSTRQVTVNLVPLSGVQAAVPVVHGVGSIAVDSNPGGASVFLDGNAAGTTPSGRAALILNRVPDGTHTVKVELAGYPAYTETINVTKNQVVKVEAVFVTRTPTIYSVTTIATTDRPEPVPVSPLVAVAATGFAGLVVMLRRP